MGKGDGRDLRLTATMRCGACVGLAFAAVARPRGLMGMHAFAASS